MSEDIKNSPAHKPPETNNKDERVEESAEGKPESAAKLQPHNQLEKPYSQRESEEADELKAIAKAFAVNLAWSMAGLMKKE